MSKINRAIAAFKYGDRVDRYRYRNRTRLRLNLCHYTIDRDTWLARHGQPLSPTRSERALEERAHTAWLKFVRGSWQRISGDWTSTTIETGKSFIFAVIKR